MTPQEGAQDCQSFLNAYIFGEDIQVEDEVVRINGIRRRRPSPGLVAEPGSDQEEFPDEAPMPDLDNVEVQVENGVASEAGVLLDFINIENALVTLAAGDVPTIRIEFVVCENYPPEQLAGLIDPADFAGKRIVTVPQDSRIHLWVTLCLDALYHHLGRNAGKDDPELRFEAEIVSGRFEELQAAGLIV